MQCDDLVWEIMNTTFCSYKVRTMKNTFCSNPYNITGLCSRQACPLANSQYATVREEKGVIYLYIKTAERSAFPKKQWERTKLSENFEKALHQINENLLYWPRFIRLKCKQRFLKITQYLITMRKLRLSRQKLIVPLQRKIEKREGIRERKALKAARIEKGVEQTLLDRLKKGVYEDLYNIPAKTFDEALKEGEVEDEVFSEHEDEEGESEDENEIDKELEREVEEEAEHYFAASDSDDEEVDNESRSNAMDEDSDSGRREYIELPSDFESDNSDIEEVNVSVPRKDKSSRQKKNDDANSSILKSVKKSFKKGSADFEDFGAGPSKRPKNSGDVSTQLRKGAPKFKKSGKPRVQIEYEMETERA